MRKRQLSARLWRGTLHSTIAISAFGYSLEQTEVEWLMQVIGDLAKVQHDGRATIVFSVDPKGEAAIAACLAKFAQVPIQDGNLVSPREEARSRPIAVTGVWDDFRDGLATVWSDSDEETLIIFGGAAEKVNLQSIYVGQDPLPGGWRAERNTDGADLLLEFVPEFQAKVWQILSAASNARGVTISMV